LGAAGGVVRGCGGAARAAGPAAGAVIPVSALFTRLADTTGPNAGGGWQTVPELAGLASGAVRLVTAGTEPVLACRVGEDLYAFRDGCARCGRSMADASLSRRLGGASGDAVLRCPGCAAHFAVRGAGACLDDDGLHLAPLPLLTEGGSVLVAVPAPVPS
jgi:nitrite reductase/ring-hydroxylating ferredoxin subunit